MSEPNGKVVPQHKHDCSVCLFLGTIGIPASSKPDNNPETGSGINYDLYYCRQDNTPPLDANRKPTLPPPTLPTLVARWSDNGPDYVSAPLPSSNPILQFAALLANGCGLKVRLV